MSLEDLQEYIWSIGNRLRHREAPIPVPHLIVESNPLEQVSKSLSRRHLEVLVDDHRSRLIQFGEMEGEFEVATSNGLSKSLEAGDHGTSLPTGDDRLLPADPLAQLSLRQAGSEPGFADQFATHHGPIIVHICYNSARL